MNEFPEKLKLKEETMIEVSLREIWSNNLNNNNPFSPIYPESVYKKVITFLSLNPSLRPNNISEVKKDNFSANHYPIVDYAKGKADYRFFQKFYDVGNELDLPWTVYDLLYIRESKQEKLSSFSESFLIEQMKLTFSILELMSPRIIVISNSLADQLIHNNLTKLNLKQEFPNENNGFIYRLNNFPIIRNESKYLGSRIHSYNDDRKKRLIKEINRVLGKI